MVVSSTDGKGFLLACDNWWSWEQCCHEGLWRKFLVALLVTSEDEGTGRSCDLCGNLQHGRWCLGSIYGGDDTSCFVVGGVRRCHLQRCFECLSRCGNINIPKTSGSRCKSEFYATKHVSYTHLIHKLLRDNLQKPPRQPPGNDRWRETLELQHSLRLAGLQESPASLNPVATAAGRGRSWLRVISSLEDWQHWTFGGHRITGSSVVLLVPHLVLVPTVAGITMSRCSCFGSCDCSFSTKLSMEEVPGHSWSHLEYLSLPKTCHAMRIWGNMTPINFKICHCPSKIAVNWGAWNSYLSLSLWVTRCYQATTWASQLLRHSTMFSSGFGWATRQAVETKALITMLGQSALVSKVGIPIPISAVQLQPNFLPLHLDEAMQLLQQAMSLTMRRWDLGTFCPLHLWV